MGLSNPLCLGHLWKGKSYFCIPSKSRKFSEKKERQSYSFLAVEEFWTFSCLCTQYPTVPLAPGCLQLHRAWADSQRQAQWGAHPSCRRVPTVSALWIGSQGEVWGEQEHDHQNSTEHPSRERGQGCGTFLNRQSLLMVLGRCRAPWFGPGLSSHQETVLPTPNCVSGEYSCRLELWVKKLLNNF